MASFEIPDLLELDDAHAKASGAESVRDGVVSETKSLTSSLSTSTKDPLKPKASLTMNIEPEATQKKKRKSMKRRVSFSHTIDVKVIGKNKADWMDTPPSERKKALPKEKAPPKEIASATSTQKERVDDSSQRKKKRRASLSGALAVIGPTSVTAQSTDSSHGNAHRNSLSDTEDNTMTSLERLLREDEEGVDYEEDGNGDLTQTMDIDTTMEMTQPLTSTVRQSKLKGDAETRQQDVEKEEEKGQEQELEDDTMELVNALTRDGSSSDESAGTGRDNTDKCDRTEAVFGAAVPRLSVGGVDAGFTASIYSSLGKNDVKDEDENDKTSAVFSNSTTLTAGKGKTGDISRAISSAKSLLGSLFTETDGDNTAAVFGDKTAEKTDDILKGLSFFDTPKVEDNDGEDDSVDIRDLLEEFKEDAGEKSMCFGNGETMEIEDDDATAVASGVRAANNDDYEEEEESTAAILQHIHRPAASDNHVGDFHCYEAERTEDILGSAYTAHKSATVATSRDKVVDDEDSDQSGEKTEDVLQMLASFSSSTNVMNEQKGNNKRKRRSSVGDDADFGEKTEDLFGSLLKPSSSPSPSPPAPRSVVNANEDDKREKTDDLLKVDDFVNDRVVEKENDAQSTVAAMEDDKEEEEEDDDEIVLGAAFPNNFRKRPRRSSPPLNTAELFSSLEHRQQEKFEEHQEKMAVEQKTADLLNEKTCDFRTEEVFGSQTKDFCTEDVLNEKTGDFQTQDFLRGEGESTAEMMSALTKTDGGEGESTAEMMSAWMKADKGCADTDRTSDLRTENVLGGGEVQEEAEFAVGHSVEKENDKSVVNDSADTEEVKVAGLVLDSSVEKRKRLEMDEKEEECISTKNRRVEETVAKSSSSSFESTRVLQRMRERLKPSLTASISSSSNSDHEIDRVAVPTPSECVAISVEEFLQHTKINVEEELSAVEANTASAAESLKSMSICGTTQINAEHPYVLRCLNYEVATREKACEEVSSECDALEEEVKQLRSSLGSSNPPALRVVAAEATKNGDHTSSSSTTMVKMQFRSRQLYQYCAERAQSHQMESRLHLAQEILAGVETNLQSIEADLRILHSRKAQLSKISMSLPEDRVRLAEEKMQKLIDRKQQEAVLEKAVVDAEENYSAQKSLLSWEITRFDHRQIVISFPFHSLNIALGRRLEGGGFAVEDAHLTLRDSLSSDTLLLELLGSMEAEISNICSKITSTKALSGPISTLSLIFCRLKGLREECTEIVNKYGVERARVACITKVVEGSKTEAPVTVITMKANPEASVFATVRLDVLSYPFQKCTSSSTPHHSSKDEDRAWEVFDGNGMMMEELQNDASARMKTWDREGGYGALSRLCSLLHDVCSSMS